MVGEVESHTAKLGTFTAVGRTAEAVLRRIAAATVTHTEGSVNKGLETYVGLVVDLAYFPQ